MQGKSLATVQIILRNDSLHENVLNKTRCGRPRKLKVRDARIIRKKVKQKNPIVSDPQLTKHNVMESRKKVYQETASIIFRSAGFNGRVPKRKPFILSANQQKRLNFESKCIDKDWDFWKTVLFLVREDLIILAVMGVEKFGEKSSQK